MGAMYAQLTAEDAARAADSALEVGRLNSEAIALLEEVQGEHSKALRELGEAQEELRKATEDLIAAGEVQDRINEDLTSAQDTLRVAQDELKTITQNLQESQRLTNQAVRAVGAAAGFAAQTGMHAAETGERAARAADEALNAQASLREVAYLEAKMRIQQKYAIEELKLRAALTQPRRFNIYNYPKDGWRLSFSTGNMSDADSVNVWVSSDGGLRVKALASRDGIIVFEYQDTKGATVQKIVFGNSFNIPLNQIGGQMVDGVVISASDETYLNEAVRRLEDQMYSEIRGLAK